MKSWDEEAAGQVVEQEAESEEERPGTQSWNRDGTAGNGKKKEEKNAPAMLKCINLNMFIMQ